MFVTRIARLLRITLPLVLVLSLAPIILRPTSALATPERHSAQSASAKSLALTRAEVDRVYGAEFRPFMQLPYGKEKRAHGVAATACKYSSGYAVMFANFKAPRTGSAVVSVMSSVFVFSDSACSHSLFMASSTVPAQYAHMKLHVSSVNGLGDGASLMTAVQKTSGRTYYTDMLRFYHGAYSAGIIVSSMGAAPRLSDVMGLAKIVDQNVQNHG